MPIRDALLAEFDNEMAITRRTLERVPDGKFDWKPHHKSFSFGQLANHVADIPGWGAETLLKESIDIAPEGGPPQMPPSAGSQKELLDKFDQNVVKTRQALNTATDEHFMQQWSLLSGGKALFTMPRAGVIRTLIMNHLIHHRAQLGVYLRLNDIPVPSTYGPSADEGSM